MTTTRVRATVVAAATGLLALTSALLAAPAHAATIDGTRLETQTELCSPSLSARTNVSAISTGAQPQVGQDFHLVVTVAGFNQCLSSQSTSVNLQLGRRWETGGDPDNQGEPGGHSHPSPGSCYSTGRGVMPSSTRRRPQRYCWVEM